MKTVEQIIAEIRQTMREQAETYSRRSLYFEALAEVSDGVPVHNFERFYYGGHKNPTATTIDSIAAAVAALGQRAAA